jgi:hypothetical protein
MRRVDARRVVASVMKADTCWEGAKSLFPKVTVGNDLLAINPEPAIAVWCDGPVPYPASSRRINHVGYATTFNCEASAGAIASILCMGGEGATADGADELAQHEEPPDTVGLMRADGAMRHQEFALLGSLIRQSLALSHYSILVGDIQHEC